MKRKGLDKFLGRLPSYGSSELSGNPEAGLARKVPASPQRQAHPSVRVSELTAQLPRGTVSKNKAHTMSHK